MHRTKQIERVQKVTDTTLTQGKSGTSTRTDPLWMDHKRETDMKDESIIFQRIYTEKNDYFSTDLNEKENKMIIFPRI